MHWPVSKRLNTLETIGSKNYSKELAKYVQKKMRR